MERECRCCSCKEKSKDFFIHQKKDGDLYYCVYCGELSAYRNNMSELVEPTDKELHCFLDKDDNCREIIPTLTKKRLNFTIYTIKDGYINYYNTDFFETERFLKVQYIQLGIIPNIGDFIGGYNKDTKTTDEERYVIVQRDFCIDDYETIHLTVVPEHEWFKRNPTY